MSDLLEPLVPADVDLRDFPFMPIDIVRLFGSDFHAQSTDAEWRAGFTLWLRSYHQVPAGSLPDDEIALTRLAELGRDCRSWRKVRSGALRGWTKCRDGRLYHRTVAEKALEGWIEKLLQRKSSGAGNAKRYGHQFDPAVIDAAIEASRVMLATLNPQSRVLAKRGVRTPGGNADRPPSETPTGSTNGSADRPPDDIPHLSQGTGKGRDISFSLRSNDARAGEPPKRPSGKPRPPRRCPFPPDAFDRWYSAYPHKIGRAAAEKAFDKVVASDTVAFETLVAGVEAYRRTKPADQNWCNPATWLNQGRWTDQPATSLLTPTAAANGAEPRIDFGGGVNWPEQTVRSQLARFRRDPSTWPTDRLGPPPGAPGCRVPDRLLEVAA